MTRKELKERMAVKSSLSFEEVSIVVDAIIEIITKTLERRDRMEIRGFGSLWFGKFFYHNCRIPTKNGGVGFFKRLVKIKFRASKKLKRKVNGE